MTPTSTALKVKVSTATQGMTRRRTSRTRRRKRRRRGRRRRRRRRRVRAALRAGFPLHFSIPWKVCKCLVLFYLLEEVIDLAWLASCGYIYMQGPSKQA